MKSAYEKLPPRIGDILRQLKSGLSGLYGKRLCKLWLFGSYARGTADEFSDLDVVVVLDSVSSTLGEISKINDVATPLSLENDLLISAIPVDDDSMKHRRSNFIRNVLAEGVELT